MLFFEYNIFQKKDSGLDVHQFVTLIQLYRALQCCDKCYKNDTNVMKSMKPPCCCQMGKKY